jgi:tetratricopeptide (TPR) repeat protein
MLRFPAFIAFLLLLAAAPAYGQADYANKQAERQLEFAQTELADGDYEKAMRSAESALRLVPDLHAAILLKAQAYEGLQQYPLAESTLLAYLETAPPAAQDPMARIALERVRQKIAEDTGGSRSRNARLRKGLSSEDIRAFEERVNAALSGGLCQSARSAAKELTLAAPDVAEGWKLAGDAARCANNTREAAISYRRYQYLGGKDDSVLEMIGALSETLATLVIDVAQNDRDLKPTLSMSVGGTIIDPLPAEGGRVGFYDLPTGAKLHLDVSGDGIETESIDIDGLNRGETRSLALTPKVVGHGTLRAAQYDPKVFGVWVAGDEDQTPLPPGKGLRMTATTVLVRVRSEFGKLDAAVKVQPDTDTLFDPAMHQPAALTVVNLPAGGEATIRMADGDPLEQRRDLPNEGSKPDPETRVLVARPQKFQSLRGGTALLSVRHPTMGSATQEVMLRGGAVNATTFDNTRLTGLAREQELLAAKEAELAQAAAAQAAKEAEAANRKAAIDASRKQAQEASRKEAAALQRSPDLSVKRGQPSTLGIVLSAVGGALIAGGVGAMSYSGYARATGNRWDEFAESNTLSDQDEIDRQAAWDAVGPSLGAGIATAGIGAVSVPIGVILLTRKKK